MRNAVYYVTSDEVRTIKNSITGKIFIAEIDLSTIKSDDEYLDKISKIFRFPLFEGQSGHSWNGYLDWMTDLNWANDLDWLNKTKNGYCLFLYNCKYFADIVNGGLFKRIVDSFVYDIIPWWGFDLKDCVIDGKVKSFEVYLVI